MTPSQITYAVRTGRLIRVRLGVYRVNGAPVDWEQSLLAAVLATRGPAVISHATAARLQGFRHLPPGEGIDVLVQASTPPRGPGIVGHGTSSLPPKHTMVVRRVPVTNPARTLVDVCGRLTPMHLAEAADDLRRRGRLSLRSWP